MRLRSIRYICAIVLLCTGLAAYADTIASYMTIANNIPTMELKPDEQSQAWARSARNILISTNETIAQTMLFMNAIAVKQGHPIFCMPDQTTIDAKMLDEVIRKTYYEIEKKPGASQNMTVSEVAVVGMLARYPCNTPALPNSSTIPAQQPTVPAEPMPAPPAMPFTPGVVTPQESVSALGN